MISTYSTSSSISTSKRIPFSDEDFEANKSFHIIQNPLKLMKFKHDNIIEETTNICYSHSHSSSSPILRITSKLATSTSSMISLGSNKRCEGSL